MAGNMWTYDTVSAAKKLKRKWTALSSGSLRLMVREKGISCPQFFYWLIFQVGIFYSWKILGRHYFYKKLKNVSCEYDRVNG